MDAADAGAITFDSSDNSGSSGNLTITEESDYQFLSTAGGSTSFSSSLYSPDCIRFQSKELVQTQSH